MNGLRFGGQRGRSHEQFEVCVVVVHKYGVSLWVKIVSPKITFVRGGLKFETGYFGNNPKKGGMAPF